MDKDLEGLGTQNRWESVQDREKWDDLVMAVKTLGELRRPEVEEEIYFTMEIHRKKSTFLWKLVAFIRFFFPSVVQYYFKSVKSLGRERFERRSGVVKAPGGLWTVYGSRTTRNVRRVALVVTSIHCCERCSCEQSNEVSRCENGSCVFICCIPYGRRRRLRRRRRCRDGRHGAPEAVRGRVSKAFGRPARFISGTY